MEPLDAFWHLVNFFWPAALVAPIAAAGAKLAWRSELRAVRWKPLALWAFGAGALTQLGAVLLLGRDGRMAGYGLLIASTTLALWWRGFGPGRR